MNLDKDLHSGHRDRLRQRLLQQGHGALSDHEVLELLLFSAIPRRDTKPLAKQLLHQFKDLRGVIQASPEQLADLIKSDNPIALLKGVEALWQRLGKTAILKKPMLASWQEVVAYLQSVMGHEPTEQFRILFLDSRNKLIQEEVQSRGTIDHTPLYVREVLRRALELHAKALILVHNHPSGDTDPSEEDIMLTREIVTAAQLLAIDVHDHLIIGRNSVSSFKSLGLL